MRLNGGYTLFTMTDKHKQSENVVFKPVLVKLPGFQLGGGVYEMQAMHHVKGADMNVYTLECKDEVRRVDREPDVDLSDVSLWRTLDRPAQVL